MHRRRSHYSFQFSEPEPSFSSSSTNDAERQQLGLPTDKFDALLIYEVDDAGDTAFAQLLMEEMTIKRDRKICHPDSIPGGIQFGNQRRLELLLEKCNNLIFVISPATTFTWKFISDLEQSKLLNKTGCKLTHIFRNSEELSGYNRTYECDSWHPFHPRWQQRQEDKLYYNRDTNITEFWSNLYHVVGRSSSVRTIWGF